MMHRRRDTCTTGNKLLNPKSSSARRASTNMIRIAVTLFALGLSATLPMDSRTEEKPAGSPTSLSLKFKVGEVTRYALAVEVEAQLPAMGVQPSASVYHVHVNLVEEEKVVRALPDGGGELAVATISGQGTSNGTPFTPTPDKKPALIGFSSRGDLLSVKDLPAGNAGMPLLSNMFGSGALSMNGVYLPDRPVRAGDTWIKQVRITGLTGSGLASVRATFVKLESIGRYKTAKIHAVLVAPLRSMIDANYQPTTQPRSAISTLTGTFKVTYDTNLAIAEGKVVRAAGNGTVTVLIQPIGSPAVASTPVKGKPGQVGKGNAASSSKSVAAVAVGSAPPPTKMVLRLDMGNNLMQ